MEVNVGFLELSNGKVPYLEWEKKLDVAVRAVIRIRINRFRKGNFGDCKSIKGCIGLYEARFPLGPGYRLYYGKVKESIIVILCGGDKGSQERDILKAKEYWQLYRDSQ